MNAAALCSARPCAVRLCASLLSLSLFSSLAIADDLPSAPEPVHSSHGALATTAAVVPGVVFHGIGHLVGGDKETAFRIAKYQLLGLSMMAASGLYLGLSGGSRYGNEISIPLLVSGSGIFINTWLADIYGSATGGSSLRYHAPLNYSVSLGYAYIRDSVFSYDNFGVTQASFAFGDLKVDPSLWTALGANNQRARLPLRYALTKDSLGQGLELQGALTYHHFGDDGFSNYTGEIGIGLRFDNSRVISGLEGSYTKLSLGYGIEHTRYASDIDADNQALLLGRSAFGLYLPKGGQLEGYYEHRRDTFTAGLSPGRENGSGFLGHFGLQLRQPVHSRFSLRAQVELGAAWLFTSGLEIGFGDKQ